MQIFSDYKSLAGTWYTFRPLNVLKREELSQRFSKLSRASSIFNQLIDDQDGCVEYNIKQMLSLYDIQLDEFEIEELDELFLDHILKVNFSALNNEETSLEEMERKANEKVDGADEDILSDLLSSTWGICDSAGDALFMIEKLPAEMLLSTLKKRANVLEEIYSTDESRRKKAVNEVKNQLLNEMRGGK